MPIAISSFLHLFNVDNHTYDVQNFPMNFGDFMNRKSNCLLRTIGLTTCTMVCCAICYSEDYYSSENTSEWNNQSFINTFSTAPINIERRENKYASVIGAGLNEGEINIWEIGNFADDSILKSTVTIENAKSYADTSIFGAGQNTGKINEWTIGNFGTGSNFTTISTLESSEGKTAHSAIFGAGYNWSGEISNWTIGDFSGNTTLSSCNNSVKPGYSSIFGAGQNTGQMNNWKIGNFGNTTKLTSNSITEKTSKPHSSIFGAGENSCGGMNNWTIGNFGNKATLTSTTKADKCTYTAVFGAALCENEGSITNWTVEFQGNTSISALSFSTLNSAYINTLGGYDSNNMRFYFNNLQNQESDTTVTIIGACLLQDWNTEENEYSANLVSPYPEDSYIGYYPVNAVAIGPNMQLNIGRTRTLATTRQENGTFETAGSIANGGQSSGSAGTFNVFGYMSRASKYGTFSSEAIQEGSVMRIDSGWEVNAFTPIANWERIEILNGTLNLIANDDTGEKLRDTVLEATPMNVFDASGVLHEAYVVGENYSIAGALVLPSKLVFGVGTSANGKIVAKSTINKQIYIFGSPSIAITSNGENIDTTQPINYQIIEVSTDDVEDAFNGLSNIIPIEENNGYSTFSGITLDNKATEYAKIKNLKLCLSKNESDKGLVVTTLGEFPEILPTDYTENFASAEIAKSILDTNQMISSGLNSILLSVKGNGNDPFLTVLGARSHQDEISGFGYKNDIWGIMLGEHYTWDLGHERYLRAGALASYSKSDVNFFGSGTSNGKRAQQDMYIGGIFSSWESFNMHHLKTNANLLVGLNYSRNKTHRIDDGDIFYRGDFDSTDLFVTLDGVKNLLHIGNWQTGPYASVTYNRVHQQGYTERANNMTNAVKLSSINQNLLDFILGWSVQKEWQHFKNTDKRIRTYACAGWHCQPIRSHSTGTAYISDMKPFTPKFGYTERNSFFAQLGFRNKLTQHLEWYANYAADISGNYRYQNLNLGLGYTF